MTRSHKQRMANTRKQKQRWQHVIATVDAGAYCERHEVGEDLALYGHLTAQQPVQQLVDVAPATLTLSY